MVDSKGQPFASSKLAGRPYAIFFGFTHCPDVCPTTLARLVKLRRQLGADDAAFQIVFVTVDPERDGPAEVGRYADLFGAPVIGLTGSPAQVARVKKDYGIFSEKVGRRRRPTPSTIRRPCCCSTATGGSSRPFRRMRPTRRRWPS